MKMMGVCRERLRSRISRAVSNPFRSGIFTSRRISAKSWSSRTRSASSPEEACTSARPHRPAPPRPPPGSPDCRRRRVSADHRAARSRGELPDRRSLARQGYQQVPSARAKSRPSPRKQDAPEEDVGIGQSRPGRQTLCATSRDHHPERRPLAIRPGELRNSSAARSGQHHPSARPGKCRNWFRTFSARSGLYFSGRAGLVPRKDIRHSSTPSSSAAAGSPRTATSKGVASTRHPLPALMASTRPPNRPFHWTRASLPTCNPRSC